MLSTNTAYPVSSSSGGDIWGHLLVSSITKRLLKRNQNTQV
jgi:hypothetical protein